MDVETTLKQAHLRYVSTDKPGFSRKRKGSGFTYLDTKGEVIHDKETRDWIESIVIPPAWKEVWISPHKNGHILAVGRDERGRKQYRYHPRWNQMSGEQKFGQLLKFGHALPHIREVTEKHLRERTLSRNRVLAAVVRLLETTLIRVGNAEYAITNDSYGLTTLRDKHAEVKGDKVAFEFVGKSGKEHAIELTDKRLARIVKQCRDIPGYDLFQYYDADGSHHAVGSADVNAYLHEITGEPFTAKVFRTWGGSSTAIKYLCEMCSEEDSAKASRECIKHVAGSLGNTKAVSIKYYIHPLIMKAHAEGRLAPMYKRYRAGKSPYALLPEEKTLLELIESET